MAGEGTGGGDERGRARLKVYRGGRARAERPRPSSPRDVARRLGALERRVEQALAAASGGGPGASGDLVRFVADEVLGAVARARRLTARDLGTAFDDLGGELTDAILEGLYRYWWRVEPMGLDRVPATGRVILVANRGGALLPYEALMVRVAVRRAHPLLDDWIGDLPLLGTVLGHAGAVRAAPATVRRRLARGEAVIASPETNHPKPFRERYRLGRFGRGAFARLAIETGTPIVPVAVIGAEEVHPVLARLDLPGRFLGLPTLPITPTFPWLGLLGLVPLPTKWSLLFGEPLDVAARHPASDASDAALVARLRDQVRERLQALVLEGLRRRRALFRG
jgi:1-acyl-sn-glycerol-3-phosphate acyltransferase